MDNKLYTFLIGMVIILSMMPITSAVGNYTNATYVAGTGEAIVYTTLNVVLLVFLIGCFAVFLYFNNLIARVLSFGIGYLLIVAITFVGWQMANDFLTSPFLIEMFRIIFLVFVIGALPLLIGAFAWYVIMLFKIKEIDRLMTKGYSMDEAERRQGRKYK